MEGQLAFFYVVPLYFRKIETFSQLLLNTCGLYFSEISCWLRKCLVPHRFMAFKPRYLQFKVYPEQGRREGNYRSDFRWEDGSWSRYEVKIQRSTGTTRPIGAPCFCLTLCFVIVSWAPPSPPAGRLNHPEPLAWSGQKDSASANRSS